MRKFDNLYLIDTKYLVTTRPLKNSIFNWTDFYLPLFDNFTINFISTKYKKFSFIDLNFKLTLKATQNKTASQRNELLQNLK